MSATILIIDDEPQFERLMRQRFRQRLRDGDFEFVFALNGKEGLDMVERHPELDMILTDINMPQMDGLTFLEELKERRPGLKAVVVSAYGDMANIRRAMNLGAFDFITKPIDFQDLETTIEKTLEEAEVQRQAGRAQTLSVENEQLQELDALKTQFFTNISHEFRTPLTVIGGMTEQIAESPDQWLQRGLKMIRRNTGSLLRLINQILDLRKLEAGKLPLNLIQGDIMPLIRYLFESFHTLAETRDVELHFAADAEQLIMDHDPEKIQRILSNLLDNAIKYTPAGGQVFLKVRPEMDNLLILVSDTGTGINPDELPHIFDRFYQASTAQLATRKGSGIGLSFVKELVTLLGGEIEAESTPGKGTSFILHLPVKREAPLVKDHQQASSFDEGAGFDLSSGPAPATSEALSSLETPDLPRVLIIEDNADVAQYLIACLEDTYQLQLAGDGQQGIEQALEQVPDLIISDVMMPRKDGFEVCQTLKQDNRTSHIPIVLMTAKAGDESRIAGLEIGADAYIAKPFAKRELLAHLRNLLAMRDRLQSLYGSPDGNTDDSGPERENRFFQELREVVENNLEDEDFGIQELGREMAMSRTQLFRKIKALTGRSASHFIRGIRLQKAKDLLLNTDLNISQISYEVGFKDPKYFSRTFSSEFGESPNNFRKGG